MILQRIEQQRLTFLIIQSFVLGIFYLLVCYLGNILSQLAYNSEILSKFAGESAIFIGTPNSHLLFDREYTNINIKWKIYENNIIRMCLISTHVGLLLV